MQQTRKIGTSCRWVRFAKSLIRLSMVIRPAMRASGFRVLRSQNLSWSTSKAQNPTSDYNIQNGRKMCINPLGFVEEFISAASTDRRIEGMSPVGNQLVGIHDRGIGYDRSDCVAIARVRPDGRETLCGEHGASVIVAQDQFG
jgi:hypothetical protein